MPSRRRRRAQRARPRRVGAARRSFWRRRSTLWLVAAVVTLTVGIVLGVIAGQGGDEDGAEDAAPTPTLAVALPDLQPDPARLQRAEVTEVIDGDTIEVRIGGRIERVRYYGLDTPERDGRCFEDATTRNASLVGETVLLLADARERDQFDRLLRYAFGEDGSSIDARLIAEGLGRAWEPDGAYRDELVALEEQARAEMVGCLWEN